VELSKDPDVLRKPLTLVVQLPELAQLDVAQRRPTTEKKGHTLVTIVPRFAKLGVVEHQKVLWKVLDHLGRNFPAARCVGAVSVSSVICLLARE
jgi:hypothetical protein